MYIDESGGTDEVETEQEMIVTVDGVEYSTQANVDHTEDGTYDMLAIQEEDGGRIFADTDGSGAADEYVELDQYGQPVAVATYDEATGEWVALDPGELDQGPDAQTALARMSAELPGGAVDLGPATVDSNHDGTPDTAVVAEPDGTTRYFTDTTGDGEADVAVIVAPDGSSTVLTYTGEGAWAESGTSVDAVATEGHAGAGEPTGVAAVDPATGAWVSR